ncbi:hypothetical protein FACS189421_04120 [Bacteroidia bacterium]|nr:hypothetical protein FACS189421_04120 [Bacteroidia bacterium]GHT48106.1 hypothetical protein FACS189440_10840 [Bacteroidia bacterium]
MTIAYYTGNYYLWVAIELIFGIIYSIILNWKVNQVYPWLKSNISEGKNKYQDNKIIITKAKQMFVHLLASTGRNQILPFLIYAFASLKIVAYYGNYMVIIDKVTGFVNQVLGSTTAGVGSLIAENNKEKTLQIYWEFITLRFFVAGVLIFSLYNLIEPFVKLWLGNEYILDNKVFIIILCNIFVSLTRGTNDQFINGYGLFHDIWAPIVTLFLTIGVAIFCGSIWGLFGVLLGDITSSIIIINIWKPYFLFKQGFQLSVRKYWKQIFKNLMMLVIVWICSSCILNFISINPYYNYKTWIMYAFLVTSLFSCLYFGGMLLINKNSVKGLIIRIVKLKK